MKKIFGLLIFCALALTAADNPFVGIWKLNVAKSSFNPGPAPQSQTVTIGEDNKVEVTGVDEKGQAVNWSYTFAPGPATITGLPDATVVETRKGHTVDHVWTIGKEIQKGHGVVSKDGKTLTYTLTGTNADGKKFSDKSLYERQ